MSILEKWSNETLTREDVKAWAIQESELQESGLTDEEIDHVIKCLYHIYQWFHGRQDLGHFLTAVVKDKFGEACGRADGINGKVLPLYAKFLYNCAPMRYKMKAELL